jgi:hypothetical protein
MLDATPAGAQVYRRIGFVPGFELERWQGAGIAGAADPALAGAALDDLPVVAGAALDDLPAVAAAALDDVAAIAAVDRAATGLERRFVLASFLSRAGTRAWLAPHGDGFAIVRAGHRAAQLGPLVAPDEAAALALLRNALGSVAGPVFVDVPRRWTGLGAWLAGHGFVHQRPFVRMALGAGAPAVPDRLFVLAGPEFG